LKATGDLSTNRLVLDIADGIALLDPNENPFTLMTRKVGKRVAKQPKVSWLEDELQPEVDQVSVATNSVQKSIEVKNTTYFAIGDLVQVYDSYEVMYVQSVTATAIVVSRNYPNVGASSTGIKTDLEADDYLTILGNANEEGAAAPAAKHTVEVQVDNYTQIIRTPFELTETELNSLMHGEQDLPYETHKKAIEHARKIEYNAIWGLPSAAGVGSASKAMRTMGGLWWYLKENAATGNLANQSELTEDEFLAWIRNCFRYGSGRKVMFSCPLILSAIEKWGLAKLQTRSSDSTYGINISRWISPHGEIAIVNHKMLEGPAVATAGGWAFLLDMSKVKYVHLRNRDTKLKTNIQEPSEDRYEAEYLSEVSLQIKNPNCHGAIYNVTSFAA
jgi:hypothetical protein